MKNIRLLLILSTLMMFNSCIERPNNSTTSKTTEANWDGCMLSA